MTRIALAEAPRHAFKFKGIEVQAPYTYAEGHTLTANEATFINRNLASVVGNLLSGRIQTRIDALVAGDKEKGIAPLSKEDALAQVKASGLDKDFTSWQDAYDAAFADYEPGVNNRGEGGSGGSVDPVQKVANQIADTKVREALKERNIPFKKVQGEVFTNLKAQYIEKNPWVLELARQQVAATQAAGPAVDEDDLFADLPTGDEDEAPLADGGSAEDTSDEVDTDQTQGDVQPEGETDPQA